MDGSVKSKRKALEYRPRNIVATFVDDYGDERVIHRPQGKAMRVFKGLDTPVLMLNRAVAVLMGERIRARRLAIGMTMEELGRKSGLSSQNPKQYIFAIEKCGRTAGVRLGTLFLLANALKAEVQDLLPSYEEAAAYAGVTEITTTKMTVLE